MRVNVEKVDVVHTLQDASNAVRIVVTGMNPFAEASLDHLEGVLAPCWIHTIHLEVVMNPPNVLFIGLNRDGMEV